MGVLHPIFTVTILVDLTKCLIYLLRLPYLLFFHATMMMKIGKAPIMLPKHHWIVYTLVIKMIHVIAEEVHISMNNTSAVIIPTTNGETQQCLGFEVVVIGAMKITIYTLDVLRSLPTLRNP